jgi:integrase
MRRFSIFRRGDFYYVQFWNDKTKKYDSRKSTGETDKNAALLVIAQWERDGIPQKQGEARSLAEIEKVSSLLNTIKADSITPEDAERIVKVLKDRGLVEIAVLKDRQKPEILSEFLLRFWDYDRSPYVREKKAHHHSIGKRHCWEMDKSVKRYWKPYFMGKYLPEIRKADLKAFSIWLAEEKGLGPKSINNVLGAGCVAIRWAYNNEIVSANPAEGLVKFGGASRERGVLTVHEAAKIFSVKWDDFRVRLANQLAAVTGLRSGEVLALQVRDIGEDRLFVRHSFSKKDGLKGTKTNKERKIPFPYPGLRRALLDLARINPHGVGPASFVFWSIDMKDRPMDDKTLQRGLQKALDRLNPKENWKRRNVVFHSWRHYFASQLADRIEPRKAMSATGHTNKAVFDAYADHLSAEVFKEVGETMQRTFTNIIEGGTDHE